MPKPVPTADLDRIAGEVKEKVDARMDPIRHVPEEWYYGWVRRISIYESREGDIVGWSAGFTDGQVTCQMIDDRFNFEFNGSQRAAGRRDIERATRRPVRFTTYQRWSETDPWKFSFTERLSFSKR